MKINRACCLILCFVLVLCSAISVSAVEYQGYVEDDTAMNLKEAEQKGIPYKTPLFETPRQKLINDGYLFYGGTVALSPATRATTNGVLGYISARGDTDVYSGKGTGTKLGIVSFREIVFIDLISGNYAYIRFKNDKGVLTYGYIPNSAVYSPAYGWSTPITSGVIRQYFGEKITDPNGHSGVDVGGHNGATPLVYSTYAGTASYRETTKTLSDGTKYFANYGKHIRLTSGNYDCNYAHLSAFKQNVSSNDYPSEGYPVPSYLVGLTATTGIIATKSVVKGVGIGNVGTTGQSSDNHLHFEVRNNGALDDPFLYVVFPNISWAKS